MDNKFLVLSLFFPRILLLVYYLKGWIPPNAVPFWGDVVSSVFVPRILVLIYIYANLGAESEWFWAHLVMTILAYASGGSCCANDKK